MALFAAGPQGSAVFVFVATDAVLGKSEIRAVQILRKNARPFRGCNLFPVMASIARQCGVLSIKFVSGF